MLNSALQWAGTTALLTMYILMSFYPNLYPYNLVAGLCGGSFYLVWSLRVRNRAQVLVNLAGVVVCIAGLVKAFG
jgi:hypothetical protein